MTPPAPRAVKVAKSRAGSYLEKAEGFLRAAKLAMERDEETAAGVLAVHAVISACDAMTVHHLGQRSSAQRHLDVKALLSQLPPEARGDLQRQVEQVLARKNFVEYDDRLLPRGEGEEMVKRASRIVERARKVVE